MAVRTGPKRAAVRPARKRVLIVEDEPLTAELVARYLEDGGYEAAIERDGHAALTRAAAWQPDLLVLDVMLPRLNGFEVLRRLTVGNGRRIAVILLTAIAQDEDRIRGLGLGADDYVAKPFSARELVARVTAVLRRSSPPTDPTRHRWSTRDSKSSPRPATSPSTAARSCSPSANSTCCCSWPAAPDRSSREKS